MEQEAVETEATPAAAGNNGQLDIFQELLLTSFFLRIVSYDCCSSVSLIRQGTQSAWPHGATVSIGVQCLFGRSFVLLFVKEGFGNQHSIYLWLSLCTCST
jgi:hypothetical protein